jgi:hypothetical protein
VIDPQYKAGTGTFSPSAILNGVPISLSSLSGIASTIGKANHQTGVPLSRRVGFSTVGVVFSVTDVMKRPAPVASEVT